LSFDRTKSLSRPRKQIGRPAKTTPSQRDQIRALLAQGASVSGVARRFGISRAAVIAARKAGQDASTGHSPAVAGGMASSDAAAQAALA
jgi:DNA invertase Pin-like site-specific DNA recombinase